MKPNNAVVYSGKYYGPGHYFRDHINGLIHLIEADSPHSPKIDFDSRAKMQGHHPDEGVVVHLHSQPEGTTLTQAITN